MKFKIKVLKASFYTLGTHIFAQILRLGSNLILTRLLIPEMFGQMAIVQLLVFGLNLLSDIGIQQNLVRSKQVDQDEFVNTLWTLQVIRGFAIAAFGILFAMGLYVSNLFALWDESTVYADPILPFLIAATCLGSSINGFSSTKKILASRDLILGKLSFLDLAAQLAGILVSVFWATWYKNVWALVAGSIVTSVLSVIFSHIFFSGIKNRWHWNKAHVQEMIGFGRWIFLSSLLGFFAMSVDRLILSGLIDSKMMGLYATAWMMIGVVQEVSTKLLSNVAFPAMSEIIRSNEQAIKEKYYKIKYWVDASMLSASGILFVSGEEVVKILYDPRYAEAGNILAILSLGLIAHRYNLSGMYFLAKGSPHLLLPTIIGKILLVCIGLPIVYNLLGFYAAVWLVALSGILILPITFYLKLKHNIFDFGKELAVLPYWFLGYLGGLIFVKALLLIKEILG